MNKFWQLIINIRDFSYHWSVKQYGEEKTSFEYKSKIVGFVTGYVVALEFIIFQTLFYFDLDVLPTDKSDLWWVRLITSVVIIGLPWYFTGRFLWKKVEHVPIQKTFNHKQFRKSQWLFWRCFLLGWIIAGISMTFTAYLRGTEIDFFGIILNEGGHSHTFKEDFEL